MYLDIGNWLKASIEYQDGKIQRLGSVVTNHGVRLGNDGYSFRGGYDVVLSQ